MSPCPESCRLLPSLRCVLSSSLQFPLGRRAACDIYWHGVSFHDNDNVSSGQVNKFPGQPRPPRRCPAPTPSPRRSTTKASFFPPLRHDRNAPQDQHEPGGADHAGAVPRGVRLLPPLLDPAGGVPAVLRTGRFTKRTPSSGRQQNPTGNPLFNPSGGSLK